MARKHVHALATTLAILSTPAFSQLGEYPPGQSPKAIEPRAADQTLGLALMSADVSSGCVLSRGSGVLGTNLQGTGRCDVQFERDIVECTYVATLGEPDNVASSAGEIAVNSLSAGFLAGGVRVRTFNSAGAATNLPFHITAFCAR
jgi:hypothetical protein